MSHAAQRQAWLGEQRRWLALVGWSRLAGLREAWRTYKRHRHAVRELSREGLRRRSK